MHRFVDTLAMAAVLVHMVCGCCWHHAHGAEHDEGHDHAIHGDACVHHHHAAEAGTCTHHDESIPHGDGCEEDACDFVRTDRDTSLEFSLQSHLPGLPAFQATAAVSLTGHVAHVALPEPGPPLPFHLAHQALLL